MVQKISERRARKRWFPDIRLLAIAPAIVLAWLHEGHHRKPAKALAYGIVLPVSIASALTMQVKLEKPFTATEADTAFSIDNVAQFAIDTDVANLETAPDPSTQRGYIAKETWSDVWPFAAEEGVLDCMYWAAVGFAGPSETEPTATEQRNPDYYGLEALVILRTAQGVYALNEKGQHRAAQYGWQPLSEDSDMWLEYPNIPGVKVRLGPVLQEGLKLCFNES